MLLICEAEKPELAAVPLLLLTQQDPGLHYVQQWSFTVKYKSTKHSSGYKAGTLRFFSKGPYYPLPEGNPVRGRLKCCCVRQLSHFLQCQLSLQQHKVSEA